MQGWRKGSTCALMKDSHGQTIVVVFGGLSKGIESWNPVDGSVALLSSETGAELGSSYGLMYAQLVTKNA